MELEGTMLETSSMMALPRQTLNILCCMCGISFNPSISKTNICSTCLANKQDVTVGITKQAILNFCRTCRRFNRPPWVYMERESKELLTFCLKKIKGLNTVKLIDAQFIWTEPHSRRIKVKLVIQKEVINNASIQQTFEVEFYEHYMQCDDCKKEFTPHTWTAQVQVRQRVSHKRTFYYLEQLILKNNVHAHLLKVEEKDEGLDFYFKQKSHALRLVEYLQTVLPMKIKASKQLISYDEQNDIYNTKHSWSAEVPRICKDDLVILPPKLARELGGVCPVLLCLKLTTTIRLLDPKTMKRIELTPDRYFHYEADFKIITLKQNSEEFLVNDCDKINDDNLNESYQTSISNLYINKIYNMDVSRMSDWQQFEVKTHLGSAIKVGAVLQGYDMRKINYEELDKLKNIPEVIIVKRVYDKNKRKNRIWQLNRLENEGIMVEEAEDRLRKKKSKALRVNEDDFEEFMDDIEVNPEIQKNIRMFKNESNIKKLSARQIERRSKQKKDRLRKIVVVKSVRKTQNKNDTNIFNEPIQEQDEDENQSVNGIEERDFKYPKNKKLGVKQRYKQDQQKVEEKKVDTTTNQEDSDSEEDEVKLYQLEDIFNKFNIDDEEGDEPENEEEQNQKFVEDFVKGMESFKIDAKK